MGRPTVYTKELAYDICALLAEGKSMRSVCRMKGMPSMQTVWRWIRENHDFREQYTRAKEESADALIEEMLDISDDGSNDFMTITKGKKSYNVENKEATSRSKLRVETRKWIASKLKPKKYGDKMDFTTGGKPMVVSFHESLKQAPDDDEVE